ncbi:hypothetical protein [Geodermatophilus amargosae]|uniref:hypothetical protein n=1 Tax=Geodermatophilus amargosae TaxID=1296565 RepID=UPI001114EDDF|nr:hypothetical protein [Geodermatophilus amargosae]
MTYDAARSSRLVFTRIFESIEFAADQNLTVVGAHQLGRLVDLAGALGRTDIVAAATAAVTGGRLDLIDRSALLRSSGPATEPDQAALTGVSSDGDARTSEPGISGAEGTGAEASGAEVSGAEAAATELRRRGDSRAPRPFVEIAGVPPDVQERLQAELQPEFGVLFADRTRITPTGLGIGEHITTIGLTGGEELIVEQRSYTQRQVTEETAVLTERQFELEFSSTHATSLDAGVRRQQETSTTDSRRGSANLGIEAMGITLGGSGEVSRTVEAAHTKAVDVARKSSFEAVAKAAAKSRSEHKVVLRLASEQRLEATSRRVLRNPNRHTPVDVHLFKVMQHVQLSHERYDVRLAWAPCVPDPGAAARDRLRRARDEVFEAALAAVQLPPPPAMPTAVAALEHIEHTTQDFWPTLRVPGMEVGATTLLIPPKVLNGQLAVWDGDLAFIRANTKIEPVGTFTGGPLQARVLSARPVPLAGLLVDIAVSVGFPYSAGPPLARLTCTTRWIMPPDAAATQQVQQQFTEWESRVAAHNTLVATLQDEARSKAEVKAEQAVAALLEALDPRDELLTKLADMLTPTDRQLGCADIEGLTELFEWEQASYTLHPGWWRAGEVPVPTRSSTDLLNAAFAKMYLPIRPGKETQAVVHILTNGGTLPLSRPARAAVDGSIARFLRHRAATYGSPAGITVTGDSPCPVLKERFTCLGTWTEELPTDGTHLEVTLSPTVSADALSVALADTELDGQAATAQRRTALGVLATAWAQVRPRSVDVHLTDGA